MGIRWLLVLAVGLILIIVGLAVIVDAPKGEPKINVELVGDPIFVNELPVIRVTIRAPRDRPVKLLKDIHNVVLAECGRFVFELHHADPPFKRPEHDRRIGSNRWPNATGAPLDDSDFVSLPAGASVTWEFEAWGIPLEPGNYRVRVRVFPFENKQVGVQQELPLRCEEVGERQVSRFQSEDPLDVLLIKSPVPGRNLVFLFDPDQARLERLGLIDSKAKVASIGAIPGWRSPHGCRIRFKLNGKIEQWEARTGIMRDAEVARFRKVSDGTRE